MTVENTNSTISYTGNSSVTTFAYNFLTYSTEHLFIYFDDVLQTSGFTITGIGDDNGGDVTFVSPPITGVTIRIDRTVPDTQLLAYQEYGPFPAKANERGLDLLTMAVQQTARNFNRGKMDKRPLAAEDNIIVFDDTGNSKDSGFPVFDGEAKMDRIPNAGAGNFVTFDNNGNSANSGINTTSFFNKMDKAPTSNIDNVVIFDSAGNAKDSGKKLNEVGNGGSYIGENPPTFPQQGDRWTRCTDMKGFIYYVDADSAQWVEDRPSYGEDTIGDVSIPYIFDTVADYQASTIVFPTGKTIHLNDRGADFSVISGTGTGNGFNVIASPSINQSISIIKTPELTFESLGAVNGADSTAALQHALDFIQDGDVISSAIKSTYITTATLYCKRSNVTIDMRHSTIDNSSNSQYAFCFVSPNITAYDQPALAVLMSTLNYGSEVKSSVFKNASAKMGLSTTSGSNLGFGMVYAEDCEFMNVNVEQSNGNAYELRQSTRCNITGFSGSFKGNACFFFMTKDCTAKDGFMTGVGTGRGLNVKQSQGGANVNAKFINVTVYDVQALYYFVGGEYKERTLTDPIYQPGHELNVNVTLTDCKFLSTDGSSVRAEVGYWAKDWKITRCLMESTAGTVGMSVGATGNTVGGDVRGNNHTLSGCIFDVAEPSGNTVIGFASDILIDECTFKGSLQKCLLGPASGDQATAKISGCTFTGEFVTSTDSTDAVLYQEASGVIIARDNDFIASSVSGTTGAITMSNNIRVFTGNYIQFDVTNTAVSFSPVIVGNSAIARNNDIFAGEFNNVTGFNITGTSIVQGNSIDISTAAVTLGRAYSAGSGSINAEVISGNVATGTWDNEFFSTLVSNAQHLIATRKIVFWSVQPSNGAWVVGDVAINSLPSAAEVFGWRCIVAGSPGTWEVIPL